MNSDFPQDEECLAGGESVSTLASHHVLAQNSRRNQIKKLFVTLTLLLLVGLVAAAIGCGIVFTENPELIEPNNNLKEISDADFSNDHVAVFKELTHGETEDSGPENLPKPLPQTATNDVTRSDLGTGPHGDGTRSIPENAALKHPVSFLYERRLNPTFEFFNCPKQHQFFKSVVTVGRESYEGYGKNKKIAKKMAAQFACAALFRLTYSDLPTSIQPLSDQCGI